MICFLNQKIKTENTKKEKEKNRRQIIITYFNLSFFFIKNELHTLIQINPDKKIR